MLAKLGKPATKAVQMTPFNAVGAQSLCILSLSMPLDGRNNLC